LPFKRAGGTQPEWRRRVEEIAGNYNSSFSHPLPDMEISHIAKSFAKWSWARFTEEVLSELQRARANKRWAGHEAACTTKPWEAEGISRAAYYQRKARSLLKRGKLRETPSNIFGTRRYGASMSGGVR
jgi:hypothetical protein